MRVWCDGVLLADPQAPVVRVDDHGLTVGDGVFETLKVLDGVPFALTRHLARLRAGVERLGLPQPDGAAIREGIDAVLAQDAPARGRLRITLTGGPQPMGSGRSLAPGTLMIAVSGIGPAPDSVAVARSPWARNEKSAVAGIKTISFAENVVALAHARERGAEEALMANTAGFLCEGTGSNVGYVIGGQARTPSLASGCLPGVTRALMLEWCEVTEIDEPFTVLDQAEELFLISSTRDIQPVSALDGRTLPAPGPVTASVAAAWAAGAAASGMDP